MSQDCDNNTLGCRSVCPGLDQAMSHIKLNANEFETDIKSNDVVGPDVRMSYMINEDVSNVVVDDDESKVSVEKEFEIIQQRHLSMDNQKYHV